MDTTGLVFDKLVGIFFRFGAHWKNLTVQKSLDVAYSQNLPDLDDLFSDESRTQSKSAVIKLIRKQVVEVVTPQATSTPDKTKIAPILNDLFFYTKAIRGRTVQELADSLSAYLALGHPTLDLFIDTRHLHFIEDPNPYNFDDLQLDTLFPTVRPLAADTGPALDVTMLCLWMFAFVIASMPAIAR